MHIYKYTINKNITHTHTRNYTQKPSTKAALFKGTSTHLPALTFTSGVAREPSPSTFSELAANLLIGNATGEQKSEDGIPQLRAAFYLISCITLTSMEKSNPLNYCAN